MQTFPQCGLCSGCLAAPAAVAPTGAWMPGAWTLCDKACGGGMQQRTLQCWVSHGPREGGAPLPCWLLAPMFTPAAAAAVAVGAHGLCQHACQCAPKRHPYVPAPVAEGVESARAFQSDALCPASTKPITSQACNSQACGLGSCPSACTAAMLGNTKCDIQCMSAQ
ncbi:hypothetical protein HaLaN_15743 [Haematococcus lacustris]|uniref:Uncharacterized protein n=1 Tax=Haematococcus lacustris TaxID=44745 RepID=A0A699Z897_HAELA|nr:hypothetical protein HaLaN_15743 [Haematococcus lacustris]